MVRKYLFLSLMLSTSMVHASSFSDDEGDESRLHSNLAQTSNEPCKASIENLGEAFLYYKKASEAGQLEAMYSYAHFLSDGKGCQATQENKKLALGWFKKAADAGHLSSKFDYAYMLENGKGCDVTQSNLELALAYYKDAAENGEEEAMYRYSVMLTKGKVCKVTPEILSLAFSYSKKSVEAGYLDGILDYGFMLFLGQGCPKTKQNKQRALEIFKQVVDERDMGTPYFYVQVLDTYLDDFGGREYINELERVFLNSLKNFTNKNKAYIYRQLGYYYYKYSECAEDLNKAQEYYEKAESYGSNVSRVLDYIKRKASQKTVLGPKSKKNVNTVQKMIELSRDKKKTEAENLINQLRSELNILKKNQACTLDIDSLLAKLAKAHKSYKSSEKSNASSTKLTHIHAFQDKLNDIEKKVFVEIGRLEAIEAKRNLNSLSTDSGSDVLYGFELKSEPSVKKLVRQNAKDELQKEKDKDHKKNQKKKKKGKKKKEQAPTIQDKSEDELLKTVCPYAEAQLVRATNAEIPEAAMKHAYAVLNTVRTAASHNDLIHLLNDLPGDYKLTFIKPEYSGVPNSDIAIEMRINSQFRVVLAFNEGQNGKQNLDLYKNQIIICDPHVKI